MGHGSRFRWVTLLDPLPALLGNGARQADGYYGTLIGSHGCRIEWYHFR